MCTSKWLCLLLLKIKLVQDLKGVICLQPNLISWLSKFMFYGNSGYPIYVYTHCQVRLCDSLQFRMHFSTCKRECGAHRVAVSEISDVALSTSWWRSLVCIYEVRDGSWKFSSSGTLLCFMKEHPLIFVFCFVFFLEIRVGDTRAFCFVQILARNDRQRPWEFTTPRPGSLGRTSGSPGNHQVSTREDGGEKKKLVFFWVTPEFEEWSAVKLFEGKIMFYSSTSSLCQVPGTEQEVLQDEKVGLEWMNES